MCELYDAGLRIGPDIDAARSLGEEDGIAGRTIRRFDDPDESAAYRHAYALAVFHKAKANLLGTTASFAGGAA